MKKLPLAGEHICVLEGTQKRWLRQLAHRGILYIFGMTGFGKTAQAVSFAENNYQEWQCISATEQGFLQDADRWLSEHKKLRSKTLLILDDIQWIFAPASRQRLFDLLVQSRQVRGLHILLISRAAVPAYLSPLWVTQQIVAEDQESLRLGKPQIKELLLTLPALAALQKEAQYRLVEECEQDTNGYALAVNAYLHRCAQVPWESQDAHQVAPQNAFQGAHPAATQGVRPVEFQGAPYGSTQGACTVDPLYGRETVKTLATQDVWNYLDRHLLRQWTSSRSNAAMRLSVYPSFTKDMARKLLGEQTDTILQDFIEVGSFLNFTAPDTYTFVPFFWNYLSQKLRQFPEQELIPLYEAAARCYEQQRELEQALRCYKLIGRTEKIADLVVYLSENAEGCSFARIAQQYMDEFSPDWLQHDPRILGAKAMLCAYRMKTDECTDYLNRLREMAEDEQKCVLRGDALAAYVRTVIACPYDTADKLKDNLLKFVGYVRQNGMHLRNIMPTGNLPSLINGGLDLLPWEKKKIILYPVIKAAAERIMGAEAIGIADAAMGEILYEQNQKTKAMAYLTKALSATDLGGTIRVQYAITAIMARLFQSENQADTAESILQNIAEKVRQNHFLELLPNIEASLALCALLKNDAAAYNRWLENSAPDEHAEFYITARFGLLVKARVYTALGREMEALYILGRLEEYAKLYKRTYLHIEILTLKAIILQRRGEEWQETLFQAAAMAQKYGLIRIFADQGAALLPLWTAMDWVAMGAQDNAAPDATMDMANDAAAPDEESQGNAAPDAAADDVAQGNAVPDAAADDVAPDADMQKSLPPSYIAAVKKECKRMASACPNYLKPPRRFGAISDKELTVLRMMAQGLSNVQISKELGVNLGTTKFHVKNIMTKLAAENRTVAVKAAQEGGIL